MLGKTPSPIDLLQQRLDRELDESVLTGRSTDYLKILQEQLNQPCEQGAHWLALELSLLLSAHRHFPLKHRKSSALQKPAVAIALHIEFTANNPLGTVLNTAQFIMNTLRDCDLNMRCSANCEGMAQAAASQISEALQGGARHDG